MNDPLGEVDIIVINSALRLIRYLIDRIFAGQPEAVALSVTLDPERMQVGQILTVVRTQRGLMVTLRDDQKLPLTVSGVDAKGQPAPLENLRFASSDSNVVNVDESGLVTIGPLSGITLPAPAQITVTADASIGPNQSDIVGILDLTIVAGDAVTLNVSGTPVAA